MTSPILLWFRQDLRLSDNPALYHAVQEKCPIIPLFIWDESLSDKQQWGGASRWWLHHSLEKLDEALQEKDSQLILRRGKPQDVIQTLLKDTDAQAVYWNRCYEPHAIARDSEMKAWLSESGCEAKSFNSELLFEPWEVENKSGGPFKVFTPFWKHCLQREEPRSPHDAPSTIALPDSWPDSDRLEAWSLLPTKPDWAGGMREAWQPGEEGAKTRLADFLDEGLQGYSQYRDWPDLDTTSRLSPHLHWGEIGPVQIWHAARQAEEISGNAVGQKNVSKFLSEVGWREFSTHLLYHFPTLPHKNFREDFDAFLWREDRAALQAWQQGKTGYPLVDAGMRQLWHTGWMHNRVRMVVGSFLVKNLLLHWHEGEAWFWDTLVDADLANNSASWQWVAGCGADAAPYFRVFNPVLQSKKFDAKGEYIRKWVPELRALSDKDIHEPWACSSLTNYPKPIVDLRASRDRALAAYKKLKKS